MDHLPPQYSVHAPPSSASLVPTSVSAPSSFRDGFTSSTGTTWQISTPRRDPKTQLRRFIIEIIAFTFRADFSALNHALGQATLSTSTFVFPPISILSQDERDELLRLARITKYLYPNRRGAKWPTTSESDRKAVAGALVIPAHYLDLDTGCVLEIISAYADHQCEESQRKHTIISRNKPYLLCLWRRSSYLGIFNIPILLFGEHLYAHARIINITAPNEQVRVVLEDAMNVFREQELGINKTVHRVYTETCVDDPWPTHLFSWDMMEKALLSEAGRDALSDAQWRRRSKRMDREREVANKRFESIGLID